MRRFPMPLRRRVDLCCALRTLSPMVAIGRVDGGSITARLGREITSDISVEEDLGCSTVIVIQALYGPSSRISPPL